MKRYIEVVGALIFDENRLLICQRPANKGQACCWEFVGGKVEKNEDHRDALVRECKEELDIEIQPNEEFCVVEHEYPDVKIRLTVFLSKIISGVPKKLEHNDIKWITVDEIDNFVFCPADISIIELIKEKFNS